MKEKAKKFIIQATIIFTVNLALILTLTAISEITAATYKQGSTGQQVSDIQTKLKRWGYYSGEVDGIYGSGTTEAVKSFQRNNGLTADGICGEKTLAALGITGDSGNASRDNDFNMLARMISAEARGEPYEGQVAVGAVILNRVAHPSFPNTLSGVLFQPNAFSPVADGAFDSVEITDSARRAAQDALNGNDPTGGALYFFNPKTSTSDFIFTLDVIMTIGRHNFAK